MKACGYIHVNMDSRRLVGLHHGDGPCSAIFRYSNGDVEYTSYGVLHRIDGPAVENPNKPGQYWVYGQRYTDVEFTLYVDHLSGEVLLPIGKRLTYELSYAFTYEE
jgi:hypothetical protein